MELVDYNSIIEYVETVAEESAIVNALLGACFAENISYTEENSSGIVALMEKLNNETREKYRVALGEVIKAEVEDLYKHIEKYIWLYNNLKDEASKDTLINLMAFRLTRDVRYTARAFAESSEQYFDEQIVKYPKNCVFVDCGAFDGYTTASFIYRCPNYSKVYLYEPMEEQYYLCEEFAKQIGEKAVAKKKGVYDKGRTLSFSAEVPGSSRVLEAGDLSVDVVSLDDDIEEPIGFLKMDIEGSESEALSGCKIGRASCRERV